MKVMISTDMEGASGIVGWEQCFPGELYYEEGRRFLLHDVNAAVQGAVDGGATEIVVTDSHGGMLNIPFGDLHPAADLVCGSRSSHRPQLVLQSLDDSYDVVLLVGMHAAAHHHDGILSHSYHGPADFFEVKVNGMGVGEPELAAALAGASRVPCGLITSDDVTAREFLKLRPGTESVVVKYALDRAAGRCLPLEKTGELIRAGAKRAVERAAQREFEPWTFEAPMTLEVTVSNSGMAHALSSVPKVTRLAARIVAFKTDSFFELYSTLLVFVALSTFARDNLSH